MRSRTMRHVWVMIAASAALLSFNAKAQDTQSASPVRTGQVVTEGDTLHFEMRGKGEPLLMISGATGDGGIYNNVAERLSDKYQVITYDRRGNSRSTRRNPQNFEVGQQARDAVAVIKAAGHQSARVFANSGGAVIALEMAKSQPQAIQSLIVHEPPVIQILPDAQALAVKYAEINRTVWADGYAKGYGEFVALVFGGGPPPRTPAMAKLLDVFARAKNNQEFFMQSELLPLTFYKPDIEAIKANKVKIKMAAGQVTLDKKYFYGLTAPLLAEQLGCEFVIFPGAHLSFMDIPDEWEPVLRKALENF